MKAYFLTFAVFAAAWIVAWFAFIGPLLKRYDVVADLEARIATAETWPKKVVVWFEAKKTLAVTFVMSLFAAGRSAVDTTVSTVSGLQPTDLAALQDKTMWSAFFGDIWSFHIIAAVSLFAAFLALKGKVTAAQIIPAPGAAMTKS